MKNKVPIAIYVRVSTSNQDFNRQISELSLIAKRSNYKVIAIISEKITGSKRNEDRAGVIELLRLAHKGKIKKVLTSEVSRVGRNVSDTLKILDELTELKISVFAKNLGIETLTPEGKRSIPAGIMFTLMAELARAEKEMLVERIKSGMKYSREVKGVIPGRRVGSTITPEQLKKKYSGVIADLKKGLSLRKVAKANSISLFTVQKVKNIL
jgi:DNA invertase Pin-like site-specific DNA recombinase